jgi:hypothetical protein
MIKIGSEVSTTQIEGYYKRIHSSKGKNYVDLLVPLQPKFLGFGALSSFLQFLITWRRLENCGRLIVDVEEEDGDTIESVVKQYYGFVGSVLAWDCGIINKNGKDLKHLFRKYNSELADQLVKSNFQLAARGDSILFPFFDHLDSRRGLLPIVYKDGVLQNEIEFENITEQIIEIATKNNSAVKRSFKSLLSDINGILYELFDNTNKWARHSHTGKVLNPNIRGIYAKFYKMEPFSVKAYTNSSGLQKYFKHIQQKSSGSTTEYYKYITFMELSVFDGGAGLAQNFVRKAIAEMTLKEEYAGLISCLKKHTTSHSEQGELQSRGLGLHRIMELLDRKQGFLKIRSGRMFLYRDFISHPLYATKTSLPNYVLADWDTDSTNPMARQIAEGTLLTILIPIALSASR